MLKLLMRIFLLLFMSLSLCAMAPLQVTQAIKAFNNAIQAHEWNTAQQIIADLRSRNQAEQAVKLQALLGNARAIYAGEGQKVAQDAQAQAEAKRKAADAARKKAEEEREHAQRQKALEEQARKYAQAAQAEAEKRAYEAKKLEEEARRAHAQGQCRHDDLLRVIHERDAQLDAQQRKAGQDLENLRKRAFDEWAAQEKTIVALEREAEAMVKSNEENYVKTQAEIKRLQQQPAAAIGAPPVSAAGDNAKIIEDLRKDAGILQQDIDKRNTELKDLRAELKQYKDKLKVAQAFVPPAPDSVGLADQHLKLKKLAEAQTQEERRNVELKRQLADAQSQIARLQSDIQEVRTNTALELAKKDEAQKATYNEIKGLRTANDALGNENTALKGKVEEANFMQNELIKDKNKLHDQITKLQEEFNEEQMEVIRSKNEARKAIQAGIESNSRLSVALGHISPIKKNLKRIIGTVPNIPSNMTLIDELNSLYLIVKDL